MRSPPRQTKSPLPQNSVQRAKTLQKAASKSTQPTAIPAQEPQTLAAAPVPATKQPPSTPAGTSSTNNANYISDNNDEPAPLSKGYESSGNKDQDKDNWDMSNIKVAPLPHV